MGRAIRPEKFSFLKLLQLDRVDIQLSCLRIHRSTRNDHKELMHGSSPFRSIYSKFLCQRKRYPLYLSVQGLKHRLEEEHWLLDLDLCQRKAVQAIVLGTESTDIRQKVHNYKVIKK